jgi:hypothetical protein
MKRIVFILSCVCFLSIANTQAQSILDQAKKTAGSAQGSSFDVGSIASSIMSKLTPSLALNGTQQPKVQNLLTGFLKKKAALLPLQQSNPTAYTSKFGGLQTGIFSKLKTILTLSQYTKFLGLKPKTNDAANVLSQLFY